MKRFLLVFLPLLLVSIFCYSQKEGNIWYFGRYGGLDFNSGSPVPLTNGQMNTNEGCLSIADKNTGKLLFYSNGDSIWDKNGNVMPNGQVLLGSQTGTQSGIIVPMPGSGTKFYVFTVDAQAGFYPASTSGFGGLAYNVVDMTLNGGLGDVSILNQKLITPTCEKVNAIKHCNGHDYWVVTHQWATDAFYAYLVTAAGVQAPVISNPGGVVPDDPFMLYGNAQSIGYLKFSHDGSKMACVHYITTNTMELFDFDNNTGLVSNPVEDTNFPSLSGSSGPYGATFSPDDSKLYVGFTGYDDGLFYNEPSEVYQYNMKAGSPASIIASRVTIISETDIGIGAFQCAPDGKVYVAKVDISPFVTSGAYDYLDVINNPNASGAACNYSQDGLFINTGGNNQSIFGLPDIVEAFFIPPHIGTLTYPTGCSTNGTIAFKDSLTGKVKFLWNFDDVNSGLNDTSSLQNPNHTFSGNGTYTVKFVITNACKSDTFTNTVVINNVNLAISAGPDQSVCSGSSVPITVTGAPGVGTTYQWTPALGLDCSTCQSVNASPAVNTTYIVAATNNGCTDKDTIVVNVINKVVATVSNDTTVCQGNNVQLLAGGGSTYSWSPAAGLSNSTISNPVATPVVTTTYSVAVTGGTCGTDSAKVIITVILTPTVNAGNDTTICSGTSAQLNATGNNINTYSWAPATGLSCVTCANPIATPAGSASYTVTVNAGTACAATDGIYITIINSVVATVSNDTTVCEGNNVQLQAGGGSAYSWSPTNGLNSSTIFNPVATPAVTTTYTVTVTGGSCGSDSAKVIITILPTPTVNAGNDTTICNGTSAQLNAIGNNINTYSWAPATGLSCVTCANPIATPAASASYTVTVNAGTACPVSDGINITVVNKVVALVNNDTTICSGNNVQLLASGGAIYSWSPAIGLSDTGIPNPVASPAASTTYTVTVGGGSCGSDSAKVSITVILQPTIDAGPVLTICRGGTVQIVTTGTNITSYAWAPASGLDCTTCASPFASPDSTTLYGVVVNFGSLCMAGDTITVFVDTTAKLKVVPDTAICLGSSVKMVASGGTSYTWLPAAGLSDPNIANPIASPTATTIYSITVTGASCPASTLYDTVTVNPLPVVLPGPDTSIALGTSAQLHSGAQGTYFFWSPYQSLDQNSVSNPVASPTFTTTYTVYVTDQNGCVDSGFVVVNVFQKPYISFPNAFSPNNDGINDVLKPLYYEIQSFDVKIYDRWGETVFESKNPEQGWDGRFGGRDAPIGTYVYIAKAVTIDGEEIHKKGNFTLLR